MFILHSAYFLMARRILLRERRSAAINDEPSFAQTFTNSLTGITMGRLSSDNIFVVMQTDASFRTVTTKERIEQIERLTFVPTIFVSFARIRIYLSFATVGISTFCDIPDFCGRTEIWTLQVVQRRFRLFSCYVGIAAFQKGSSISTRHKRKRAKKKYFEDFSFAFSLRSFYLSVVSDYLNEADVFAFAKIGGMDNKLKMVTGECLRAPKACEDSSSLHATMTIGTPKYTNVYVSPSARYVKGDLDDESFRLTAFMQLSALHYKGIRAWIALLFLDDGNDDDIDVFGNEMDFYDAANSDEELL
ncbi:hypothetical protein Tco_0576461 [Tanacetum coccineum]